jgi:lipopolysaccharide/colanic/teichoic acid biosynthesis glycosyltransferase
VKSRPSFLYESLKRTIDLTTSLLALLVGSPLWLALGAVIRITTGPPVLFRATVVGRGGKPFTYFKFRSMHAPGSPRIKAGSAPAPPSDDSRYKILSGPERDRVTPIGRFLRRTALDEIPQFLNVLRGDMSIVGPRPPILSEYETYNDLAKQRLAVKPGITGLYQVTVRGNVDLLKMVTIDLDYIKRRSTKLDLQIMFRTAAMIITGRGSG